MKICTYQKLSWNCESQVLIHKCIICVLVTFMKYSFFFRFFLICFTDSFYNYVAGKLFVSQCQLKKTTLDSKVVCKHLTFDWGSSLKKDTSFFSSVFNLKKGGFTANLYIDYTMGGLIYVWRPLLRGKYAKSSPKKNHDRKCFIAWCELAGKIAEFSIVNQRTGASSSAHYSITLPVGL